MGHSHPYSLHIEHPKKIDVVLSSLSLESQLTKLLITIEATQQLTSRHLHYLCDLFGGCLYNNHCNGGILHILHVLHHAASTPWSIERVDDRSSLREPGNPKGFTFKWLDVCFLQRIYSVFHIGHLIHDPSPNRDFIHMMLGTSWCSLAD